MRTIQSKISLEPMISRLPSIWPAYKDDTLYFFDDESLKKREYEYPSNYGMLPLNVIVPKGKVPMFDDRDGCVFLSWDTFSKWYYFFVEYYNLLKQYGHCNRVYTSAEDYYNYESADKYADQMIYGTDKQTYIDLDNEFAENGGIVKVMVYNKTKSEYSDWLDPIVAHDEMIGDETTMVDVRDKGFFEWICENVVPTFELPIDYTDYWHTNKLFYPDVVRWLAWFRDRNEKYADIEDCKLSDDCCDCDEYKNRGGNAMYDLMNEWYGKIKPINNANDECLEPNVITEVNLQTTIDDLGGYSIFSKEYELGTDYRTVDGMNISNGNVNGGTVVSVDGESMMLEEGSSGFTFDKTFMEKRYDKCGWSSYTDKYMKENLDDFKVTAVTYFAYDKDNVKYTTSGDLSAARAELKDKMSRRCPLVRRELGWYLIGGGLYEVNETEYAIYNDKSNPYMDGKKFIVYRDRITNTPYVNMGGNDIYAEYYQPSNKFYFSMFKKEGAKAVNGKFGIRHYQTFDRFKKTSTTEIVEYNGKTLFVSDIDKMDTLDDNIPYRVFGYAVDDEGNNIYCTNDGRIVYGSLIECEDAKVDGDTLVIEYNEPFTIYPVSRVTGRTISKLTELMSYDTLTDDVGNDIDGIYSLNGGNKNQQPKEGEVLELIYQVGNTANISRFRMTETDINKVGDENYFVGDIITRMVFYYRDYNGVVVSNTIVDAVLTPYDKIEFRDSSGMQTESFDSTEYTSLAAIKKATDIKEKIEEDNRCYDVDEYGYVTGQCIEFSDEIWCNVTYYKGATLSRKNGKNFNLADGMNHGVEYTETVRFVKENREYYLKKPKNFEKVLPFLRNKPELHSVSYPVVVYSLKQDVDEVRESQFDWPYSVPMAKFEFNIMTDYTADKDEDMMRYNGTYVYPVMRDEYMLGASVPENVDADIYIERGINASYEKHLKLGEVVSLEALENYSNGYFKMMPPKTNK